MRFGKLHGNEWATQKASVFPIRRIKSLTSSSAGNSAACFPSAFIFLLPNVAPYTPSLSNYFSNPFSLQNPSFDRSRFRSLRQECWQNKLQPLKDKTTTKSQSKLYQVTDYQWKIKIYKIKTVSSSRHAEIWQPSWLLPRKNKIQVTKQEIPNLGKGRIDVAWVTIIQSSCVSAESSP